MKLTYDDFINTGWQDCANAFDADTHYDAWRLLGRPNSAVHVVQAAWGRDKDQYKSWLSQASVAEILDAGLTLRKAYQAWRGGWQACAKKMV